MLITLFTFCNIYRKHVIIRIDSKRSLIDLYRMIENEISTKIIGLALEVHKKLGPGLLESAYKECLYYELVNNNLLVQKEEPVPIIYKEVKLDHGYRIDLLVNKKVVIEIKCVDVLLDIHKAQLLTYLRLGNYRLGLLLNFNTVLLKDGITRIIDSKRNINM